MSRFPHLKKEVNNAQLKDFLPCFALFGLNRSYGKRFCPHGRPSRPSHQTHLSASKGPRLGNKGCDICHIGQPGHRKIDFHACNTRHSSEGAYDGVNDPEIAALYNWDNINNNNQANQSLIYEDDNTLKPGKERWCAGCHDDEPAYSKPQPIEIVVDNQDPEASFAGARGTSSWVPGFWKTDYHYHTSGPGTDTFTWTLVITTPGDYTVFARWTEDPSRAWDATYTIHHDTGVTPVPVDQRSNGGTWISLGNYSFDGSADYIELAQNINGYVIADAVKLELQ